MRSGLFRRLGKGGTGVRVLFVGDYDLAGSYIASRLYREGDQVCWLTQEEELELWDRKVKGKVYRKPVTYSLCRKILAAELAQAPAPAL